jgi:hypothetical protein
MAGRYNIAVGLAARAMDETPEELEWIRREAEQIDVNQYRKRFRALKAIGLGAAGAGLVWLVLTMLDSRRNPCERVRDHFCRGAGKTTPNCTMYGEIFKESEDDPNPEMRRSIRAQCQTKIERLRDEDGVQIQ